MACSMCKIIDISHFDFRIQQKVKIMLFLMKPANHSCRHAKMLFLQKRRILRLMTLAIIRFLCNYCIGTHDFFDLARPMLKVIVRTL